MEVEFFEHNTLEGVKDLFDTWATTPSSIESVGLSIGKNGAYVLTVVYTP